MDGIFGVGLAEMLIIALALFIIGGPQNTAKWARELGRMVRKGRMAWAQMLADMESELGPEGKEIIDAARELGQGAREVATMTPARRMLDETVRMIETAVELPDEPHNGQAPPAAPGAEPVAPGEAPYPAWVPPDKPHST